MKRRNNIILLTLLMSMLGSSATAHDIEVVNSDGVTIYYTWTNNGTALSVSYRGSVSSSYSNEYTGTVIIPASVTYNGTTYPVTSIGSGAFDGCTGLTSVTIPEGVTSIGSVAFFNCSGLTSLTIPKGLTSIDIGAFYCCSGLTSLNIPKGVTSIGYKTFYGCSSLTALIIGNSVTSIGNSAFQWCHRLTSVTFPNSVTSIGESAFDGCSNLTRVTAMMSTPVDIDANCFTERSNAKLYVPAGCKDAYEAADYWKDFQIEELFTGDDWQNGTVTDEQGVKYTANDDGTTCYVSGHEQTYSATIIIPDTYGGRSVTSIEGLAFRQCSRLTLVTIGNRVTSIGNSAFYGCSSLTSVTIPNSVTSIGDEAFRGCSGLTSVTIPNSVTSIDRSPFSDCSGLTSIIVENDNAKYDSRENCNAIIESNTNTLVAGCKTTVIPNSVTSIEDYAFQGCRGLTSINIPNSVTYIGIGAFWNCSGLREIAVPERCCILNHNTFYGCSNLRKVTLPRGLKALAFGGNFGFCTKLDTIEIGVRKPFGNFNEDNFSSATYANATLIVPHGSYELYKSNDYWNRFEHIIESEEETPVISRTVDVATAGTLHSLLSEDEIARIENLTITGYLNGSDLRLLRLMGGIDYKGNFSYGVLSTLDLSDARIVEGGESYLDTEKIQSSWGLWDGGPFGPLFSENDVIGNNLFRYCMSLSSVILPFNTISIGEYAFMCNNNMFIGLQNIVIPKSVDSIGTGAFYDCSSLTSLTIPEGVTSIGERAFYGCSDLTSIYVKMETPLAITAGVFSNLANATLYVPYGTKALYAAADVWKEFKEIVEFVDETNISEMDDAIYVEPTEVISGNQAVLSVKMKNDVAIQTIQFDLYLPEGVTVVTNEDNELITASKERINKFNYFDSEMRANGALRLLVQATTTNVPAGDGEICRVTVNVPESMAEGDYPIIFKGVLMVEANNTSHSPDPNVVQCKLTVLPYTPGDANNDGAINAIDFNMIGNYILRDDSQANFSFRAADFNNDGDVNAIDFNMVGNHILYGSSAPSSRATRKEETLDPQ